MEGASMIQMQFAGQFGNQLHQYVTAKIIAERTGLAYAPTPTFFNKSGACLMWSGEPYLTMTPTPGRVLRAGTEGWQVVSAMQWIDLDSIRGDRPVSLRGYFQRYELLRPWKDKIRNEWLHASGERITKAIYASDPEAVYVHVRRTDYVDLGNGQGPPNQRRNGCATTIDEYRKCLAKFGHVSRIRIITDDYRDPFVAELGEALGVPWIAEPDAWDNDFLKLASARRLCISQSTFSWWAAWLGRAEQIVCPMFADTFWRYGMDMYGPPPPGESDFPNLFVDDEPGRWIWVTE